MSFKKIVFGAWAFSTPITSFADRYGIYDDHEEYGYSGGGGGNDFFGYTILFFGSIAAYLYLFSSYEKWKQRKENNEKPQPKDDMTDWAFTIIGYLVVAVFICFPILLIMKWVESAAVVREYWLWVYIPSFAVLTYLRRT